MAQDIITARLKNGITGIKLYKDTQNFIELKDFIEVRGTFGALIEQKPISGQHGPSIDLVLGFNTTLPSAYWTWYGFQFVNNLTGYASGTWIVNTGTAGPDVKTALIAHPNSTGSGTLMIRVDVGQLILDTHIYTRSAYVALPYEVVEPPVTAAEITDPPKFNNEASDFSAFLKNDGVDIFFDLQSRRLSLTTPKAETVIASDSKVTNSMEVERLLVKAGETLWLNLRFVKGTTTFDPEATGLRFGVAGKVGGPLLMEGDTFTKVGVGSAAYYRMRVTAIENEFGAIIDDYYDDDSVEQISEARENQPGASGDLEGLCEVVLTTGTGATIADLKSDTLGVVLKRSIF